MSYPGCFGCFVGRDIVDTHKVMSWIGSIIGMPFLAAALIKRNRHHENFTLLFTLLPVGFLCLYKMLPRNVKSLGNTALPTLSVISFAISCASVGNLHGIYAAVSIVVAGIIVGVEGKVVNIPTVDIFHYILACANIFYMNSMK